MPTPRRYVWDERSGRYRQPSGRFVSRLQVRTALDEAIAARGERMRELAEQLRTRKISVRAWEISMRGEIKAVHLYSAAAARGGWAQLTQADYGRVGQRVRFQYERLNRFAGELRRRKNPLPLDGRFLRRVQLYAQAGRGTFYVVDGLEAAARGLDEERNIRHASDSCAGCIAATRRGWVPQGTLPLVGTRDCLTACKCLIRRRNSETGQVAA